MNQNIICVRQSVGDVLREFNEKINPVFLRLLEVSRTDSASGPVRIEVCFEYERSKENPWGDFVKVYAKEKRIISRIDESEIDLSPKKPEGM